MNKFKIILLITIFSPLSYVYGQEIVKGQVSDQDGISLPGANVVVEGTTQGVTTDLDGNFSITVESGQKLIFSFLGKSSRTIEYTGQQNLTVVLTDDLATLDEVVVTALGFKEKRDEQGATSSIVNTQSITRSGEATLINSLSGKASNVQIVRPNGDPGAGSAIRIRGASTIGGSSQPLIIVDGVPLNNSTSYGGGNDLTGGRTGGVSSGSRLNDINPNDIESLQILKGASAAALWGSRAANGVIVITTKSGSSGKAKVSFKSTYSVDVVAQRVELQDSWGQGRNGSYSPTSAESWGDYIPDRAGGADVFKTDGERFVAESGTVYYPIETKNSKQTFNDDNWDDVIGTGQFFQNDLTVSGGNENNTYFFSLSDLRQEGIIKNSSYDRSNVRLNVNSYLNDYMTLSNKLSYTRSSSNRIQASSNTSGLFLGLLRTSPDFDNTDYKGTHISAAGLSTPDRQRSYRRYLGNSVNPIYNNPLWTTNEQVAESTVNRYLITTQFNLSPVEWLQIINRGNVDYSDERRVFFFPIGSADGDVRNGAFNEDIISNQDLTYDLLAKATYEVNPMLNVTATLGWSINDETFTRNTGRVTGFLVNSSKETTSLNTAAESSIFEKTTTRVRSNRGYGILNFDIADQLFINVSSNLEASSTVSDTFLYSAFDLAWNFTEQFQIPYVSFGKFRASWGQVGVRPDAHQAQTLAEGAFTYTSYSDPLDIDRFGGGFRVDNNLGNPDLKPEIKTEWEVGSDLRFLNNALTFSFTYYQNEINDILLDVSLSPSSGYATKYGNFGKMSNKGLELDLGWNFLQEGDFRGSVSINWSQNKNEVLDLAGTTSIDLSGGSVSSRAVKGEQLGVLYGTGSQTDDDGNFILNADGFPQLTTAPIVLGDPNPDWRGGIVLNLSYKNIGFSAVLEHSQGGDFSPRTLHVLNRFGMTKDTEGRVRLSQDLKNYRGDVIPAGTTVRGQIKNFGGGDVLLDETWYRTGIGGGFGDNQAYNFAIQDATFTKLREVTLTYSLDGSDIGLGDYLSSLQLSASGRNILNINNVPSGIDPETVQTGVGQALGIEYFSNPQTQSYLFSVMINL